jgi:hypothetical protein
VQLRVTPDRFSREVETAGYFCAVEALQNAVSTRRESSAPITALSCR